MRWLLFLSRLAFISGICILVWLGLSLFKTENNEAFTSTIIVIGYLIGLVVLPVTNISYLVVRLSGRKLKPVVPGWLVTANLFFLILLLYCFFYLNDPYYHQK